jgi:integrase
MTNTGKAYQRHDGIHPLGEDAFGRKVWRIRGVVGGTPFDERFTGTITAARKRRDVLRAAAHEGRLAQAGDETVEAFFERYVQRRIRDGKLREGKPANTHRGVVERWVVPNLPRRLADVTTANVQNIPDAMIDAGRVQSTPQVRAVVVGAFRWAVDTGLLARNPASGVSWPEVRRGKRPAPSLATIKTIVQHVELDYRTAIALDAATGLRASELAGIRWSDVVMDDLEGGACPLGNEPGHPTYPHLHVEQRVQRVNSVLTADRPKSERGSRWIPLGESTIAMLRKHRKDQLADRVKLGPAWEDNDLIFPTATGTLTDPDRFGIAFRRACKAAGISGYSLHGLRHAFVTRLVAQRDPVIDPAMVSRMAGHATVAFTLQTYYSLDAENALPVAAAVDVAIDAL